MLTILHELGKLLLEGCHFLLTWFHISMKEENINIVVLVVILGELILLAWGVYLCVKVRKAPSAFNESKYISVCIYNETIMALFSFAFVL